MIITHMKQICQSILFLSITFCWSQASTGKLFIIGGGEQPGILREKLIQISNLSKEDYIAVLPMASQEPDSAFIDFKNEMQPFTENKIVKLNFTKETVNSVTLNDSLSKAKIVFITGGDQVRFMEVVKNTPIAETIYKSYKQGNTIAGTSAGAAVMSKKMITGNQLLEKEYTETFNSLRLQNTEIKEGLGLLENIIIDQHFLKRSRYNRLISAIADNPTFFGIGIDESTAIIVHDSNIEVVGTNQVLVVSKPKKIKKTNNNLFSLKNISLGIYTNGQTFKLSKK